MKRLICISIGVTAALAFVAGTGAHAQDPELSELKNPDARPLDIYGFGVNIGGRYALVGNPGRQNGMAPVPSDFPGRAYLFSRKTKGLLRIFEPKVEQGWPIIEQFGWPVAVSNNFAAISAALGRADLTQAGVDGRPPYEGVAYIYDLRDENAEPIVIKRPAPTSPEAPATSVFDIYGFRHLAMDNNRLLASWDSDSSSGIDGILQGAVHLFDVRTGRHLTELLNPDPRPRASFALSVALSGSFAVVGSEYREAFVYQLHPETSEIVGGPWTIVGPTGADTDDFAFWSVGATSGGVVAIGAPGHLDRDNLVGQPGKVYVYRPSPTGYLLLGVFQAPVAGADDLFGWSVQLVEKTDGRIELFAGAPWADLAQDPLDPRDPRTSNQGAVYRFDLMTGKLLQTFVVPVRVRDDWFGASLSADSSGMVTGAPGQASNLFVPTAERVLGAVPGRAFLWHQL